MEPWYKVTTARAEVREGRSFNPDEFAPPLSGFKVPRPQRIDLGEAVCPKTSVFRPSHSPRTTVNKPKHLHAKDYAFGWAVRVQRSAGVSPAVALGIVPTQGTHKGCPYTDFGLRSHEAW